MSLDIAHRRPGPLLPRAEGRGFGLFFAITLLAFLASLAAGGGLFGAYVARDWLQTPATRSATASVTVHASGLESADAAAARAAETLAGLAGVAAAEPFDGAPATADTANGTGSRSVTVRFKSGASAKTVGLAGALGARGLAAMVDDHGLLTSPVRRTVILALLGAAGVLVLVLVVSAIVVALVARGAAARGHALVGVLRSAGAVDGLIVRLFRNRFAATSAQAGLMGALLAIAACAVWRSMAHGAGGLNTDLSGAPVILWANLAGAAPWPIVMALIGAAMARGAARRVLQRAP